MHTEELLWRRFRWIPSLTGCLLSEAPRATGRSSWRKERFGHCVQPHGAWFSRLPGVEATNGVALRTRRLLSPRHEASTPVPPVIAVHGAVRGARKHLQPYVCRVRNMRPRPASSPSPWSASRPAVLAWLVLRAGAAKRGSGSCSLSTLRGTETCCALSPWTCREVFLQQPCLLELEAPLKICGACALGLWRARGEPSGLTRRPSL